MHGRDDFFQRGSFIIGDGKGTRFLEDAWLGNLPLAAQYSSLYNIVTHKNVKVANVLSNLPLNIRFRRVLRYDRWDFLLHLVEHLKSIHLNYEVDSFLWSLTASGIFSVGSLYADFMIDHTIFQCFVWMFALRG
jgi:hypothetical protein